MKDDLYKKFKSILSGSSKPSSDIEKSSNKKMTTEDDLVNNFMDQLLDMSWVEEDLKAMCAPSYHLSKKSKSYWLMNTTIKSLSNVKAGVEIIPIENGKKNTICLIGQSMYSIPNDLIICSGWN